jgi:hypothetical protein
MNSDVWLFPYLALERRVQVGPWRLIPRRRLRLQDVLAPWMLPLVRGLGAMYEPPEASGDPLNTGRFGCLVAAKGRRLGEAHELDEMESLRLSVTAGLLAGNPMKKDKKITAHAVSTSDNAILYGHRISPDAHVSAQYGAMARTLVGGYTIGEEGGAFRPPAELHLPLFGTTFDAEYASVLYCLLRKQDSLAIRLARAIEWLDITWKNTTSITPDVRIVASRSGLEVLLSTSQSDKVFVLAEALSLLLDTRNAVRQVRPWSKPLADTKAKDPRTDLEWWFVEFSLLRNDIAHGNAITPARYSFNGEPHVMLGERALRSAIRATVLPYGKKSLRLDPVDRKLERAVRAAIRAVKRQQRQQSPLIKPSI